MLECIRTIIILVVMCLCYATQVMGHSCDYNTCYYACYGLGQECVNTCYNNCMNG